MAHHPVVAAFLANRQLLTILREYRGPRTPLIEATLALREALSHLRSADEALELARSINLDGQDGPLCQIFLMVWGHVCHRTLRYDEMSAVLNQALSFGDTIPEIKAALMINLSLLAEARGEYARRQDIMKEVLNVLPPSSPRHSLVAVDCGMYLAQLGRETEIDARLERWSRRWDSRMRALLAQARFVDGAETGRIDEAVRHWSIFEGNTELKAYLTDFHRGYHGLLERVRNRPPFTVESPFFVVADRLLAGDAEGALRCARVEAVKDPVRRTCGAAFWTFDLLRAEIASGHLDAARRLLRMGGPHYWNDFFLARIEWRSGNRGAAAGHFAAALKAADRYRARGRLDLELRLACELSPMDVAELVRSPGAVPVITSTDRVEDSKLLGKSRVLRTLRSQIAKLARLDVPVLISGETGTGKELVARALHEAGSKRGPWIAVNCGAISDSLIESELFGHERGAFTGADRTHRGMFEAAHNGTLFLDEIGDISPRLQVALLRVLETGEVRPVGATQNRKVRVRLVTASNADLRRRVEEGRFRQDLYYRLCGVEIQLPPLRKRPEDIPILSDHFLNLDRSGPPATMTGSLVRELQSRPWPGNVRELRHAIERMRLMNSDKLAYDVQDLDPAPDLPTEEMPFGRTALRRLDRLRALFARHEKLTRGEAARILGVSVKTAGADLKALRAEGLIRRVEPSASPRSHYFVLNR